MRQFRQKSLAKALKMAEQEPANVTFSAKRKNMAAEGRETLLRANRLPLLRAGRCRLAGGQY